MKNVLIDSHELIWILFEPERFSPQSRKAIQEAKNIYVSIASIWELALKHNKRKLAYSPEQLLQGLEELGAKVLQIDTSHILALKGVESNQGDPFDNIIVAQAKTEDLLLLTADRAILALGLEFVIDGSTV